ncbi:DUF916 domain-containing protein [Loigolactobacillus zhaoyuanensis]|uniref:WxL protein peptidoglycan domain-containing protein n=1 Tax=Loigolactobacillus zhaoyuanensis TaxID=2486017 RepID=A0ABW8UFK4_9LACO|nr:DUF916 domain-containing protein [Loigolactobacillus zhaoyuanensis]
MSRFSLVIISCLSLLFGGASVAAATPATTFSVSPVLTDLPVTNTQSFFNLQVKAGTSYQLPVKLSNTSTTAQQLTVQINNAQTTDSGVIDYSQAAATLLSKSAPNLASMVDGSRQQQVTLQPQEQRTVSFTIKTPVTAFAGTVLGGITVTNQDVQEQATMANRTRYALSVALVEAGQPTATPKLTAGKVKYDWQTAVGGYQLPLRNVAPLLWHDAQATLTITNAQHKQVARTQLSNFNMAPRTAATLFLPHKRLASGDYTYRVTLKSGTQSTTVKQSFTVKAAAKTATKSTQPLKHTAGQINWWLWLGIALLGVLGLSGIIYWLKHRH